MRYDTETLAKARAGRDSVGLIDLSSRGRLRITGRDRATWLQGLISNDVLSLPEGAGMEAALLNVQGHLLSFLRVFSLPGALWIDCPGPTRERVLASLDQYLMMEQVEIEDVTPATCLYSLQGPKAGVALAAFLGGPLDLPGWGMAAIDRADAPLLVARVTHTGEDGYDLLVRETPDESVFGALVACAGAVGGEILNDAALDILRVEAGIPAWGSELTEAIVPLEARLDRAISRAKGCYVGQEIIARIDARGQVNNVLVGLDLTPLPPFPSGEGGSGGLGRVPIRVPGAERAVGRVTSAAPSLAGRGTLALGYLRREHAEPGTEVVIAGADQETPARVAALPFVPWRFPVAAEGRGAL